MGDEWKRIKGFWGFLTFLLDRYHYRIVGLIVGLIVLIFVGVWGVVHWNAEPGQEVVVWGLFKYTKRSSGTPSNLDVPQGTPSSEHVTRSPATLKPTPIPTPTPKPPTPIPTPTPKPPTPIPTLTPKPPTPIPTPTHDLVVCVVNDNNQFHANISRTIVALVQSQGMTATTTSVSTIGSFSQFESVMKGNTNEIPQSGLVQYGTNVLLGKTTVSVLESPELENLITATVSLTLYVMSSRTGSITQSLTITQKGPGFSQADATNVAEERIIQELATKIPHIIHRE